MRLLVCILFSAVLGLVQLERLSEKVLEAFEKDKRTYATYRQDLKELSCKLLAYSKLREMFEMKEMDVYFVHPGIREMRRGFYLYVKGEMMSTCKEKITEVDVIFRKEYFLKYVSNANYDKLIEVNMTQLVLSYINDNYNTKNEL